MFYLKEKIGEHSLDIVIENDYKGIEKILAMFDLFVQIAALKKNKKH